MDLRYHWAMLLKYVMDIARGATCVKNRWIDDNITKEVFYEMGVGLYGTHQTK